MTNTETLTLSFYKDGEPSITYVHDELGMNFILGDTEINCSDAEEMNSFMNLLAANGYENETVIF